MKSIMPGRRGLGTDLAELESEAEEQVMEW